MTTTPQEFNWSEAEEEGLVIIKPQVAIAIYTNPSGDAVIRAGEDDYTDECFIVIPRDKIKLVADALQSLLLEG